MIADFYAPDDAFLSEQSRIYLGWFALIAFGQFLAFVVRTGSFVLAGERLTRRLRTMTYRNILRQEVAFFDDASNSVGRLSTRLAQDAADVKGGTGEGLSLVVQSSAAIIAGIVIAFVANWRLALVVATIFPFLILSSLYQGRAYKGFSTGGAKALEESGHIAVEATAAIRTVAAFNLQGGMVDAYTSSLVGPQAAAYGQSVSAGIGQGFSVLLLFGAYSLAFYAGACELAG